MLAQAEAFKSKSPGPHLNDKVLGMLFFNPSLRTRTSFETAMLRGGGHAVTLDVGGGVWKLEQEDGAVMDGDKAEHIKEAVPVLSRYVDMLAVRSFGSLQDVSDQLMSKFKQLAEVPVINMESAREHPCQGLADLLTIKGKFGNTKNLPVTLTWAPHIKPLPHAVPNSFLLTAAAMGCDVRVAHPPGFDLHTQIVAQAEQYAQQSGGHISFTHDQSAALTGSQVVYAKSWGSISGADSAAHADWVVDTQTMNKAAHDAIFLHCLPVRRNVEVADAVLDGDASKVIDQAENRFHVQRALLDWLSASEQGTALGELHVGAI
ncbi:MAG: N-acetylornithine carbamoyltransferase [Gammaproteobacteria bacterium]|nr:N-acetylornithine carbamoyltransferase [Gammaproteobacteria bacterium]